MLFHISNVPFCRSELFHEDHRTYRQKLKEVSEAQPCLPYVALVLRDLIHVKDAHTKYIENEKGDEEREKAEDERSDVSSTMDDSKSETKEKSKKLKKRKKLVNVTRIFKIGRKLDEVETPFGISIDRLFVDLYSQYFAYISTPYNLNADEKLVDSIRSADVYSEVSNISMRKQESNDSFSFRMNFTQSH
jgi:hypothetical protein